MAPVQFRVSSAKRESEGLYRKTYDEKTCEVHVSTRITLEDYARVTPVKEVEALKEYAKMMAGKRLVFINATYAGGGVAIMRAPLVALLRNMGVDAHWYVLMPDADAFLVTKHKFHNVLQAVADPGVELNDQDKALYERWIEKNARAMKRSLTEAEVIIIDDWQPSGLIPYIKRWNPEAPILFRDHIQSEGKLMGTPGTPQYTTWRYIWDHNQVKRADAFIVHPRDEFVPPDVPDKMTVFMPATCDLLDDLNRPLSEDEIKQGRAFIDGQLAENEKQKPIDFARRYIFLSARFDPAKGMPEGMAAYARARQKMLAKGWDEAQLPQLVIVGNGSVDDPDGIPVLAEIMKLRREDYAAIKDDIKVARVPHNDMAINSVSRGAALYLQPSLKEGFEMRVTDSILQGVPVIGSNRGGIPLQIIEGKSGYVIDPSDTEQWAERITELMTDVRKYEALKKHTMEAAKTFNYQFTTVPNAIGWLHLSFALLTDPHFVGNRRWVRDIVAAPKSVTAKA
jgi:alpha,alpha-trehalose phosphorylase (configuration-retaining)